MFIYIIYRGLTDIAVAQIQGVRSFHDSWRFIAWEMGLSPASGMSQ